MHCAVNLWESFPHNCFINENLTSTVVPLNGLRKKLPLGVRSPDCSLWLEVRLGLGPLAAICPSSDFLLYETRSPLEMTVTEWRSSYQLDTDCGPGLGCKMALDSSHQNLRNCDVGLRELTSKILFKIIWDKYFIFPGLFPLTPAATLQGMVTTTRVLQTKQITTSKVSCKGVSESSPQHLNALVWPRSMECWHSRKYNLKQKLHDMTLRGQGHGSVDKLFSEFRFPSL